MGEGIDKREWLKPGAIDGYTRARQSKGELVYNHAVPKSEKKNEALGEKFINDAYANGIIPVSIFLSDKSKMPLDRLYAMQIIDSRQHWTGEVLARTWISAYPRTGYSGYRESVTKIFHAWTNEEINKDLSAADILKSVMSALSQWQRAQLEKWCFRPVVHIGIVYADGDYLMQEKKGYIADALDIVEKVLEKTLKPDNVNHIEMPHVSQKSKQPA